MPLRHAILIAALAALLSAGAARAQPLDLAGYLRLLRTAHAAAARGDRLGLEEVAPALAGVRSVALPDGGAAPADNRWLAGALDTPRPDLPAIAARLGAQIDALTPPAGPPAADAEARLRAILAGPPFGQGDAPREPGWLDRLLRWLGEQLGRIIGPVGRAAVSSGGGMAWLLAIAGLLTVGLVLAVWARGLRGALAPAARIAAGTAEADLSAAAAATRAAELARAGDYRGAARMLYLSSLLRLDERGRLRYERTLTNREYLDRLGHSPDLRERLRPVVETFDGVWYGGLPLDAEGYARYARQVEDLTARDNAIEPRGH